MRTGMNAFDGQVTFAEALYNGRDVVLLAGTGWGKTLAFVMACFLNPDIVIIIVSPLNALEEDQARRFRRWGLTATAVNANTLMKRPKLIQEIEAGKWQIVITSPENLLSPQHLKPALTKIGFAMKVKIVIDEAHCIALWGNDFRPAWGRIGEVHGYVSHRVPIGLASATAPRPMLTTMKRSVNIAEDKHVYINLGNFRPNLYWKAKVMEERQSLSERVDFLVPENPTPANFLPNECALVYVNSRRTGCEVLDAIRAKLPPELHHTVEVYHALRGPVSKAWILERFFKNGIRILICTEAAGMGCDFPNVHLVVQYMATDSLISWVQRAGRGGRDGKPCTCILLVEPGVVKEKLSATVGNGDDEPGINEELEYSKKCDETLRQYILTDNCRWQFIDTYFGNPPHGRAF
ncbi:hypothetical protein BOTBODRAFT_107343 [Botryobasidium botryosum FD-172 SS1]|uniref:DNA 3'-5' helicase n=1 Tax=Botryobasidium botryosum (strain FD-172 SS1) TaxID=930990 RepID=A0A067MKH5_BOTB1|nr:hypothetical protein BOTBODRAFT_107343 [Botryobasidium botryosum FD-172 SS1]